MIIETIVVAAALFGGGDQFNPDAAVQTAQESDGNPYTWGLEDCSGYLSEVFSAGTGTPTRFTTDSDFAALGWEPGYDPNGLSISTNGGTGVDGHMTGELYGVPIESDGTNGVQYGPPADGAQTYPEQWHWPAAQANTQAMPETVPESATAPATTIVVQAGDTLSALVGPDWPAIAQANGIDDPDLIYPGQRIRL